MTKININKQKVAKVLLTGGIVLGTMTLPTCIMGLSEIQLDVKETKTYVGIEGSESLPIPKFKTTKSIKGLICNEKSMKLFALGFNELEFCVELLALSKQLSDSEKIKEQENNSENSKFYTKK